MFKTGKLKGYESPKAELVRIDGCSVICTSIEKSFSGVSVQEYDIDGDAYVW